MLALSKWASPFPLLKGLLGDPKSNLDPLRMRPDASRWPHSGAHQEVSVVF